MRASITCVKCGKQVVKMYGYKDLCNLCYTRSLNLTARGKAEMKKLKDELKEVKAKLRSLRTTLANTKLSLKRATRINERLEADHRADFEWDRERIKQYNKEQEV
jgi:5-bromo-4-chloroindolyl phosphate hydrolysis protein